MKTIQALSWGLTAAAALMTGCGVRQGQPDGSGTIECTQVQVAPSVAGRVAVLPPQEGAALKKGDLVARLDVSDYALRRDEAQASLALAQAQLELLRAGARAEDVLRARAGVREARAAAEAAAADQQRVEQVFAAKSATQKQFDDARARAEQTAAALAGAEQNLLRLEHGNRPEEIHAAEAQAAQGRARLAQAEKAVADCVVTAPLDGVVTTRSREEGEWVTPGAPLVTLARLDEVWLSIYVPETRLGKVKLGHAARRADAGRARQTGLPRKDHAEKPPRHFQTRHAGGWIPMSGTM